MSEPRLRLRVFAGPNGSGKSTYVETFSYSLGIYVNADQIEKSLRSPEGLDLSTFDLQLTTAEARASFAASSFAQNKSLTHLAGLLHVKDDRYLSFGEHPVEGYLAAIVAEVVRGGLVAKPARFSFETVMSSPDKVDLMRHAKKAGFKVYLYYFCTASVEVNVDRVAERVEQGGHPVNENKIRSRYIGSLDNLAGAVRQSDVAYLYDNSGLETRLVATVYDGHEYASEPGESTPVWVQTYLRDRLIQASPLRRLGATLAEFGASAWGWIRRRLGIPDWRSIRFVATRFTGARRADVSDVLTELGLVHSDEGTFTVCPSPPCRDFG